MEGLIYFFLFTLKASSQLYVEWGGGDMGKRNAKGQKSHRIDNVALIFTENKNACESCNNLVSIFLPQMLMLLDIKR